jgi:Protein of unknown function (DUF4235)
MSKWLYKAFSALVSLLGGMAASAIFKQIWRIAAHEEQAPSATDARRRWPEVLAAAALEGAIFAVVKAALNRGTDTAARQITGTWPGEKAGAPEPGGKDQ